MSNYRYKPESVLSWQENRARAVLEIKNVSNRVQNEVLAQLDIDFEQALNDGKIKDFKIDADYLKRQFAQAQKKALA